MQLPVLCFGDRGILSPSVHLRAADGALELSPTPGRPGRAMVVWSMDWSLVWSMDSPVSPGLPCSCTPCPPLPCCAGGNTRVLVPRLDPSAGLQGAGLNLGEPERCRAPSQGQQRCLHPCGTTSPGSTTPSCQGRAGCADEAVTMWVTEG